MLLFGDGGTDNGGINYVQLAGILVASVVTPILTVLCSLYVVYKKEQRADAARKLEESLKHKEEEEKRKTREAEEEEKRDAREQRQDTSRANFLQRLYHEMQEQHGKDRVEWEEKFERELGKLTGRIEAQEKQLDLLRASNIELIRKETECRMENAHIREKLGKLEQQLASKQ